MKTEFKVCTTCHRHKPLSSFSRDARICGGLRGLCRACKAEDDRKYRQSPHRRKARRRTERNPYTRIRKSIRTQMSQHTDSWPTPGLPITTYVPWTFDQLVAYIEAQFHEGMTWQNYGSKWHLDHIKPQDGFTLTDPYCKDFQECWALSNLQPLWAHLNMSKGKQAYGNRHFGEQVGPTEEEVVGMESKRDSVIPF